VTDASGNWLGAGIDVRSGALDGPAEGNGVEHGLRAVPRMAASGRVPSASLTVENSSRWGAQNLPDSRESPVCSCRYLPLWLGFACEITNHVEAGCHDQVTERMFSPSMLTIASVSEVTISAFWAPVNARSISFTLINGIGLSIRLGVVVMCRQRARAAT
jgi:hypothetical protein